MPAPAPEMAIVDAAPDPGKPAKLGAANFVVSVMDRPAWTENGGIRLGYLRHGAVVMALDHPVPNDDCTDGWFALVEGGYVCGKAAALDLQNPRVRLAPKQPNRQAGMPYKYGFNLVDGTPLYRRVLNVEDRKKYEPELVPVEPVSHEETEESSEASPQGPIDAGVPEAGKPTLKQLKGRGVLVRKMVRGFYLALDRDFRAAGARWWRTTFGFATPFERIALQNGVTKYQGSWFLSAPGSEVEHVNSAPDRELEAPDAGEHTASAVSDAGPPALSGIVGFVATKFAHRVDISEDQKKITWGAEIPKRTALLLTGESVVAGGVHYVHTAEGFWVRQSDLKLAAPSPPPDLAPNEKWIDVDLTRQALVAFEGSRPVFATLISSGKRNPNDPERDFPTPTGTFRIREKHVTTTMDGDVASDGPYSIEDVPWVMYFQGSYALHGAFWHDAFGYVRSHGCVNMAPEDARRLFAWSDPPLPEAWHGVMATDGHPGTRLVVHEDAPPKKKR